MRLTDYGNSDITMADHVPLRRLRLNFVLPDNLEHVDL